ncbi:unnamed protein product [Caenorhabditis angaria]|uniref:RING-type domain-containing protein n=1 Tax=Caenorhabditis angaria TaxID=860376 RepID=A0A9P1IA12_9PELO|nr:unnamed protein product [Caenorhabditis angaria]
MNREKFRIDKYRILHLYPLSSKNPIDVSLTTFAFPLELNDLKEFSVLYVEYETDSDIRVFIDVEEKSLFGKDAYLVTTLSADKIGPFAFKLLKLSAQFQSHFKLAGIEFLWSLSANNRFQIDIQAKFENLLESFDDEKIVELSQSKVGRTINSFFTTLSLWNSNSLAVWPTNPRYNSKEGSDFFAFFNALQKSTEDWQPEAGNGNEDKYQVRDDLLNSQLMDYQKTTVKWMISREIDGKNTEFFGLFQSFPIQSIFYYPAFGVFSRKSDLSVESIPSGGILADEMGLGKTLEMLALIVSNRKDNKIKKENDDEKEEKLDWKQYKKKKGQKNGLTPVTYTPDKYRTEKQIKTEILKNCTKCKELCVSQKCGWKMEFDAEKIAFLCPQCMAKEDALEVGTTLIIMPETLSMQWYQEIVKHCNENLRVMFYFGLKKNGYLNPHNIAKYDLIFVTYETLFGELPYANFKNFKESGDRKYSPSSMNHVKWWRLIADESQLVETGTTRPAQMCQILQGKYKWAMTGTPILKDIHGLGGLFDFIDFWPLSCDKFWDNFVIPDFLAKVEKNEAGQSWLIKLGSQVMRRNSKSMVEAQIKLPELVEIEKIVKFSTIEERQYKNERDRVRNVIENFVKNVGDESLIKNMKGREKIMGFLGIIKESLISCGEHLNMGMVWINKRKAEDFEMPNPKNIVLRMICKKKEEIEEIVRQIIKCSISDAEIQWLDGNFEGVAKGYEEVLRMIEIVEDLNRDFEQIEIEEEDETGEKPAKMPKIEEEEDDEDETGEQSTSELQIARKPMEIETNSIVHTMVNLQKLAQITPKGGEIIENFGGISKVREHLDSSILKFLTSDLAKLDEMHLNLMSSEEEADQKSCVKIIENLTTFYENQEICDDSLVKSLNLRKLEKFCANLPFWPIFDDMKKHFADGAVKLEQPVSKYHNEETCMGICNNLSFSELYPTYKLATNFDIYKNLSIHLSNIVNLSQELNNDFGLLIDYFKDLSTYDNINNANLAVFPCQHSIINRICVDENERKIEKDKLKCKICRVRHSLTHFRFLIGLASFHGIPKNENVRKRFEIAEFIEMILEKEPKREFVDEIGCFHKYTHRLVGMSRNIRDSCIKLIKYEEKLRNLSLVENRKTMEELTKGYPIKADEENFDRKFREAAHNRYSRAVETFLPKLNQFCTEFRYLVTLCCEEGDDDETRCCPVCWKDLDVLAIFPCAHRICQDCFEELKGKSPHSDSIACSTCCQFFKLIEIIIARQPIRQQTNSNVIDGITLAVKLEETIKLIREILQENEENKIILFTNFEIQRPIWKFLTMILGKAKVPFIEVNTVHYGKNMSEFENSKNCRVLLCSLSRCANGLNLTHANHIIFLDPTHLSSVIQQAIGRIARIGQKNAMKVYHMIVETSIDEEIRKIARSGMHLKGTATEKTDLTVGQLRQMFGIRHV